MIKKILNATLKKNKEFTSKQEPIFVVIKINEKIMPIDRGEYYEDPLDEFLKQKGYGEVTGGGTMQLSSGEIEFCDIEVCIVNEGLINRAIAEIKDFLELRGVPKGSYIEYSDLKEPINFGIKEGIAIYLDGVNLPIDVYEECNSNYVVEEIIKIINEKDSKFHFWEGEKETALYFYVDSYIVIKNKIDEFVKTYPLCKNSRIVQIS